MNRVLFVHAGPPKTATTSIQRFFHENAGPLAHAGLYWPKAGTEIRSYNHLTLALALRPGVQRPGTYAELERELLDRALPSRVLLSAEQFADQLSRPVALAMLQHFAQRLNYRLHIILYIRPQAPLLNSLYTQNVKNWRPVPAIDSYLDDEIRSGRHHYMSHFKNLFDTPDISVTVRPFNTTVMKSGVIADICEVVGLPVEIQALANEAPAVKIAPGPKTVEAFLRIRRRVGRDFPQLRQMELDGLRTPLLATADHLGWNTEKCGAILPVTHRKIEAAFAKSNGALSARFWSTAWQDLFSEMDRTPPAYNMFDPQRASAAERREFRDFIEHAMNVIADLAVSHQGQSRRM